MWCSTRLGSGTTTVSASQIIQSYRDVAYHLYADDIQLNFTTAEVHKIHSLITSSLK